MAALVGQPCVHYIDLAPVFRTQNFYAKPLMQVRAARTCAGRAIGAHAKQAGNGGALPLSAAGLDGAGEVVAVGDTGPARCLATLRP